LVDKINICGVQYSIEELDTVDNDPMTLGLCVYTDAKIMIKKDLSKDRKNQTFIHELTHAIAYEAGFDEQNEDVVNRFGKVLFQVLSENSLALSD